MQSADYGLLFQGMPELKPAPIAEGILKGIKQGQEMGINQQNANSQTKQVDAQAAYQQQAIDKIKQEMNFEQLDLTNKLAIGVSDEPTYQNFLTRTGNAGIDNDDMPRTYDARAQAAIKQMQQLSGVAKQQLELDLLKAQAANQNAQATKASQPAPLTNSNVAYVKDPNDPTQVIAKPLAEAVAQGTPVIPNNKGTTVNVGDGNFKLPNGYKVNPKYGQPGEPEIVPISGGPEARQTPQQAGLTQAIADAIPAVQTLRNIVAPGGKIDRTAIATMTTDIPGMGYGVPFTEGRQARQAAIQAIDSKIRAMTGAALNANEQPFYEEMFLPGKLDNDATINQKLENFDSFLRGTLIRVKEGMTNEDIKTQLKPYQTTTQAPTLEATPEVIAAYKQKNPGKTDEQIKSAIQLYNQKIQQQQSAQKKSPVKSARETILQ